MDRWGFRCEVSRPQRRRSKQCRPLQSADKKLLIALLWL